MNNTLSDTRKTIIVFTITYTPFVGGAEVAIEEITKRLPGYRFIIVTGRLEKKLPRFERRSDTVEIVRVGIPGYTNLFSKNFYILAAVWWTFWYARKHPVDLVWSVLESYAAIAGGIYKFLRRKTHYILTLQSGDSDTFWQKRVGWWKFIFKQFYACADTITTISEFLRDRIRDGYGYAGQILTIPNGVSDHFFELIDDKKIQDTRYKIQGSGAPVKIVFSTSRLEYKNGIDILIRAFARLITMDPKSHLILALAGSGSEEKKYRELVNQLAITNQVRFLGTVPNTELPAYYQAADVFCRPSRTEGQGISFFEAFASRIPVVGTDAGGQKEFLHAGKTGYVAQAGDEDSLVDTLRQALIHGSHGAATRIENAWQFVQAYRWEKICTDYQKLFAATLAHEAKYPLAEIRQFIRYVISGGSAAATEFMVYSAIVLFSGLHYQVANVIGVSGGMLVNFTLQRYWTFRAHARSATKQFGAYILGFGVHVSGTAVLLHIFIDSMHIHEILAKVISAAIMLFWNFFLARNVIFKYF